MRAESIRAVLAPACLFVLAGGCDPSDPTKETLVRAADPDVAPETPPPPPRASETEQGPVTITWTGCGISKAAYITEAAEKYRRKTGVRVDVTGGGATRGIRATVGRTTDIGGTCRHALPERFPDEEGGARLTHVAWDALVFFTHPTNPVSNIELQDARDVLTGKIRNWSELGGPDELIVPVFRRQTVEGKLSGVGYMTRLLLFDDPEVDFRNDAITFTSSGPVEEYVTKTPFTFAVTGVSSAKKKEEAVKILDLGGVPASKHNIQTGDYPLVRPLYLVTLGEPSGPAKDFIDWIVSAEGQAVLSEAGTVNLEEGRLLMDDYRHWPTGPVVRKL